MRLKAETWGSDGLTGRVKHKSWGQILDPTPCGTPHRHFITSIFIGHKYASSEVVIGGEIRTFGAEYINFKLKSFAKIES
jgi:hypothetical protein